MNKEINKEINYEEKSNKEDKKENDSDKNESPIKEDKNIEYTLSKILDNNIENRELNKGITNIEIQRNINNNEFDESSFETITKEENRKLKSLPLKRGGINLNNFQKIIKKKENEKKNDINEKKIIPISINKNVNNKDKDKSNFMIPIEYNNIKLMATFKLSIDKIEEIDKKKDI